MLKSSKYSWRFWLVTLSALAMMALTFTLGVWQLDRATQKETISLARKAAQPQSLSGRWLADQTVYIDNRQMNDAHGKAKQGFFVVTPLMTSSQDYVLVERGWIARDFVDRRKLQPIQTPTELIQITARSLADPTKPSVIAENAVSERPIVQFIDVKSAPVWAQNLHYKGYVQQIGSASEGMLRNWYEPASGVDKHYGYAFQWFALCALLAGLYGWFQWLQPRLKQ